MLLAVAAALALQRYKVGVIKVIAAAAVAGCLLHR
jgi:chromate transporter